MRRTLPVLVLLAVGCTETETKVVYVQADAASDVAQDASPEAGKDVVADLALDTTGEVEANPLDAAQDWDEAAVDVTIESVIEAGCLPAPCLTNSWNCDPACGELSPNCAAVCDINGTHPVELPLGVTTLQIPAVSAQVPACSSCGPTGQWWTMLLKLPYNSCGTVVGPSGVGLGSKYVHQGDPAPSGCYGSPGGGCGSFGVASGPDPLDNYIVLVLGNVAVSSLVTFDVRHTGECSSPNCNVACNGWPY